ncbi:translocation/assembly module TamB domain-containing protein [Nonlabens marinus]|uniref:Translocation and assembly module TamB C-terminal domain-containing protein n=1 Tax=Nonlabens marinus S1-08 TaxID=1454201 RepID=W8W0N6_9FLAO|nr:translocation/assembly module TamB [Nonlabens marinus]BAO56641.1 hypothetical protein NMS_2632 [Nonlabens marinus S1-08]
MSDQENKKTENSPRKYRWLRRLGRIFLGFFIFLVALVLFIRSPWGQGIIVDQVVNYVEGKTGTEVSVEKLFVTFDGDIQLDGLYLADQQGDTLFYSKHLEADVPLWPIIQGNGYSIENANWNGFKARISRKDTISGFNYQFLIDAFAVEDTTTTTEPLQLSIGDLDFKNFDITLKDEVDNLNAVIKFDEFQLSMNELDLEKMIVDIDQISLKNAIVSYDKDTVAAFAKAEKDSDPNTDSTIAEAITDDAGDSPLPLITVGNLKLDQVKLAYESVPDAINLNSFIGFLETSISKADVQNSSYVVDFITLNNSEITLRMRTVGAPEPFVFEWPELDIAVKDIDLNNNDLLYTLDDATVTKGYFNPNALDFDKVHLVAEDFVYQNAEASVDIKELSGSEASGIVVNQLGAQAYMSDTKIMVADLNAQVNNNSLQGKVELGFSSMNQFMVNPENLSVDAQIPSYKIDLSDVFLFAPELRSNKYLATLSQRLLTGSLKASGSTKNLGIPNLVTNWGNETAIIASGSLRNATDVENLYVDFPSIKMRSTRKDLTKFISEKELGIQPPERFSLAGSLQGRLDDIETKATLTTSNGSIELNGGFKNQEVLSFNAIVKAQEVDLGVLLQNPQYGKLNLDIEARGSGNSLNDLDAMVDATINSFTYSGYEIQNLPITGNFKDGNGAVTSTYRDDNIDLDLNSQIVLDSVATQANLQLDIEGVDLRAFGITNQNVKAAGKLTANFKGNLENYEVTTNVADGIAVYDQQSYLLGNVNLRAYVQPDSTAVDVKNKMLDLQLRSNTDPANLASALQRHIDRYLTTSTAMDTIPPVVMKIKGTVSPSPILRDVILPSLEALDTVNISVDFNERDRKLNTDITVPYFRYAGSEIDSLLITSRSDATDLRFSVGFKDLEAGPLGIKRTKLTGVIAQNELNLDFISYDDDEKLMQFGSTLSRKRNQQGTEDLIFKLKLEDLILNKQRWSIPDGNSVVYTDETILFNNFKLSNDAQSIEMRNDITGIEKQHVGLLLENFRLQAFLSFLNPDEKLASGRLNGQFVLEDVFQKMGFSADLRIDDFNVLQVPLGVLSLDANSGNGDLYSMNMTVKGENVDLDLTGDYRVDPVAAELNLGLDLQKLNMSTVTGIASEFLSEGKGNVSGSMKLTGTTLDPVYEGQFNFNNAGFTVNMLNAPFTVKDEILQVDNKGITMNNFEITDADNNSFIVDGTVGTENLLNPTFDLRMTANNFTALNSTAKDNELYYGKATFDARATITGDLNVPVVDLTLDVDDSTNVTYVIPPTELDIVQREGIVQFVNKENPDDILTQTEEESATLTGYDITADLKISSGAKINVIVDPSTGDNLQVAGDGDLKFRMTPNGRMTLAGRYEISDGFYELSLYDIVSRRFELAKGGSVSWSGDPFDANLDVRAIYKVETSASALMASQTSGADVTTKNRFRQELPFLVYLNVDGELMQPVISFRLDMPEDEQGAIGGQVYGRVQQLNNQDQELNKQVFSLLVLNKFFPTSGADGSSGGTAAIARDNINQALSDQLNQFGGQLLGNTGVDLNFGLDSYTDYQGNSPQERTQLDVTASKKLLDDRLIVSVGSEVDLQGSASEEEGPTPVIGNVSIEYLLTESGQWRLKGFRRNQYDNVIDGQLIISGISLIFTKEFNEFKNLFAKTVKEEADKAKKEEEKNARKEEETEVDKNN